MLLQAIVLALIQGITEFLPISSSAHLVLTSDFAGWKDQGLAFDVSVHLGSLGAVLLYFRRDLLDLLHGGIGALRSRQHNTQSHVIVMLAAATLPITILGALVVLSGFDTNLRGSFVIAAANLLFAPLLLIADRCRGEARMESLSLRHALAIGGCQALAVVPGTSRSGVTMMAALMLGYSRTEAARIAMLLAIPSILGAGVLTLTTAAEAGSLPSIEQMAIGTFVSFSAAYTSIAFLLRFVGRIGMTPFVLYRLILGIVLIVLLYPA